MIWMPWFICCGHVSHFNQRPSDSGGNKLMSLKPDTHLYESIIELEVKLENVGFVKPVTSQNRSCGCLFLSFYFCVCQMCFLACL